MSGRDWGGRNATWDLGIEGYVEGKGDGTL